MKRHAFLITGFNNWGKTFIIQKMFNRVQLNKGVHKLENEEFIVLQHSNDDLGIKNFIDAIKKKVDETPKYNFVCAFCPTKEEPNDSKEAIRTLIERGFMIHLLYIVHKWDCHAKLEIGEIKNYYKEFSEKVLNHIEFNNPDSEKKVEDFKSKILEIVSKS